MYLFFIQSGAIWVGKSSGTAQQVSTSPKLSEAGQAVYWGKANQCQNSLQKQSGVTVKFCYLYFYIVHTLRHKVV